MKPAVTILVPVHNQERFIGRCLRSLLAQDMPREMFEIVVINDGSTDRTPYAMELCEDEIHVLNLENQAGLPTALNTGLEIATGEFVVRVDSDDYVNSRFVSILSAFLHENPDMDAVACDYYMVDNDEVVLGRINAEEAPIACGIMFRIEDVRALGGYDPLFLAHEDLDFRHRYLQSHSIFRVPLPLYRYRRHDGNMTNDSRRMAFFRAKFEGKHELGESIE